MKYIILVIMISMSLLLASCKDSATPYDQLDTCIDQMVEEKDNKLYTETDKKDILNAYIKDFQFTHEYEIENGLTYSDETAFETIMFSFVIDGNQKELSLDDIKQMINDFKVLMNNLNQINDDIYYDVVIKYESFHETTLTFTNELLFIKLDINIEADEDMIDLYQSYEDLFITLGNDTFFHLVDIHMKTPAFEVDLSFKLNLGHYGYALGQLDDETTISFDEMKQMIKETMKQTILIPIEGE